MEQSSIYELFFKFLSQFQFKPENLDYSVIAKHEKALQTLTEISQSRAMIFDLNKKEVIFSSTNYGELLGYHPSVYKDGTHQFFESKIHPDEKLTLALYGISSLKMFNSFSSSDKMSHKTIYEYRMLNAENKYVRLVEQYQILELDKTGQVWLMMGVADVSPSQEKDNPPKCQLLNYRTGNFIPLDIDQKPQLELTNRELEILGLVRDGLLSKEISDKLSISVHTVNTHRQRFLEKLGANNSFEAVVFATKYGLLES